MHYRLIAFPLNTHGGLCSLIVTSPGHLPHYIFLLKQAKICMVLLNLDLWKVVVYLWAEYNFKGQFGKFQKFSGL